MRRVIGLAMIVCAAVLTGAAGCDCSACEEEAASMNNYKNALNEFYEATDSVGDWDYSEICLDEIVADINEKYFCETMLELCKKQRKYNDCIKSFCAWENAEKVACD